MTTTQEFRRETNIVFRHLVHTERVNIGRGLDQDRLFMSALYVGQLLDYVDDD